MTAEARLAMLSHPWPENIRGLQRWLTRLVIEGVTEVSPEHLPERRADSTPILEPPLPTSSRTRENAIRVPAPEQVLETLEQLGSATRPQLEQAMGLPERNLERLLPLLVARGQVEQQGKARRRVYTFPSR